MLRRAWPICLSLMAGCVGTESGLPLVGDNPFTDPNQRPSLQAFHDPATEAVALRVTEVGQRILAANPDLKVRPTFQAIGSPQPEIFHRDSQIICISQGLVSRCANDAELAAVLCVELGRLVSEREAKSALQARNIEREPPAAVSIGTDSGGTFGAADAVRLAELGKFEKSGGRPQPRALPPDPILLAKNFLARAGHSARDLEAVQPHLKEAEKHSDLEKRLTGGSTVRPWLP